VAKAEQTRRFFFSKQGTAELALEFDRHVFCRRHISIFLDMTQQGSAGLRRIETSSIGNEAIA
jgi:hypothetical protein